MDKETKYHSDHSVGELFDFYAEMHMKAIVRECPAEVRDYINKLRFEYKAENEARKMAEAHCLKLIKRLTEVEYELEKVKETIADEA